MKFSAAAFQLRPSVVYDRQIIQEHPTVSPRGSRDPLPILGRGDIVGQLETGPELFGREFGTHQRGSIPITTNKESRD